MKKPRKSTAKGKEVPHGPHGGNTSGYFPTVPAAAWDPATESEDSDDGFDGSTPGIELELLDGFALYDIYGVRIFKKEITNGKL